MLPPMDEYGTCLQRAMLLMFGGWRTKRKGGRLPQYTKNNIKLKSIDSIHVPHQYALSTPLNIRKQRINQHFMLNTHELRQLFVFMLKSILLIIGEDMNTKDLIIKKSQRRDFCCIFLLMCTFEESFKIQKAFFLIRIKNNLQIYIFSPNVNVSKQKKNIRKKHKLLKVMIFVEIVSNEGKGIQTNNQHFPYQFRS